MIEERVYEKLIAAGWGFLSTLKPKAFTFLAAALPDALVLVLFSGMLGFSHELFAALASDSRGLLAGRLFLLTDFLLSGLSGSICAVVILFGFIFDISEVDCGLR